jgi:diguanylate cyclase (GGDEF)-like protein
VTVEPADPRNVTPPAREWRFWAFAAVVVLSAGAVVAALLPDLRVAPLPASFWMVAALVVLGELRPLFTARTPDAHGVVVSTTFLFAVLLLWGLAPAVVLQVVAVVLAAVAGRKALWRIAFTAGQYVLSWTAAYWVMGFAGRYVDPGDPVPLTGTALPAVIAGAVTYFVVSDLLVSACLALRTRTPVWDHFFDDFPYQVVTSGALLALAPLVVLAAERSWVLVPLIVVPLFAVYQNARITAEQQHLALHDPLTGVPNRTLLFERADEATAGPDASAGLLVLDLDRFKDVNDSYGHHAGDEVLQELARRLGISVRPGDTVARLGGDEFAVLLPDVPDAAAAVRVAERVVHALERPFMVTGPGGEDAAIELGASVGVALFPAHAPDVDGLFQKADLAMYAAKQRGAGWSVYAAPGGTAEGQPSRVP